MINSKFADIIGVQPSQAGGVEQVSEGYYRFHLPRVIDNSRVQEMKKVFEEALSTPSSERTLALLPSQK